MNGRGSSTGLPDTPTVAANASSRGSLEWISAELGQLASMHLERRMYLIEGVDGPYVSLDGRRLLLAASNDYLGLRTDGRVVEAAKEAVEVWGAGSGASPLVSGYTDLHAQLEAALAEFKGKEDCVVFSSGYLANLGTITSLVSKGDVVFSDELNHASIIDGCRLSGAEIRIFRHRDYDHLDELARKGGFRRGLVVTDSVFSMDGDVADLGALVQVAQRYGLMTMIDEAHATGVVGDSGRGLAHLQGVSDEIDVIMGTLSKALGSQGGFVAGSSELIRWLRNRARGFIYDTAAGPAAIGAALRAVEIVRSEEWRRQRIRSLRNSVVETLRAGGLPMPELAAGIVPVVVGEAEDALAAQKLLADNGVFAPAIRPPSVPPGTARIRLTLTAAFGEREETVLLGAVARVAEAWRDRSQELGPDPLG